MRTIFRKELADYFTSWRVFILFLLVYGISAVGLWSAHQGIRGTITSEGFVFLKLFTTPGGGLPPLTLLIHLIVPWIGIALGFDAINREYSSGTMSRILSQPLYRDSVINGKFLAGIVTLAVMLLATVLIVSGVGLAMIGVPPTAEEIIRLFLYLFFTIVFGAFWMGMAMLFSVITKRPSTSFLSSFALWLFFSIFISLVAQFTANSISPIVEGSGATLIRNVELMQTVMRFSPNFLLQEASLVLLQPPTHGSLLLAALVSVEGNPLSLGQSLLLVWPHLTALVGLTIVCFGISYVVFMRQEVRST